MHLSDNHSTPDQERRRRARRLRLALAGEQLEPRTLLAGDIVLESHGPHLPLLRSHTVSPAWFAEALPLPPLAAPLATPAIEQVAWDGAMVEAHAQQWIVQLATDAPSPLATLATAHAQFGRDGFEVVRGLGLEGKMLIRARGMSFDAARQWLNSHPQIASFEPDIVYSTQLTPNDASFNQLWGLHNTGQTAGTADADIDAPEAWDLLTGGTNIVVGVIDTGVNYNHPDLAANMWRNPGEVAGNNIDDDGNGFIDDVYGYDFANNDGDPLDDNRHGTHVAGTIAGVGNNAAGITGVNWTSSIMALKFLNSSGSGSTANAVRAVNYATLMRTTYGIDIRLTNNSWGGGGYSQALYDAVAASGAAGMLFVAAAGNNSANSDSSPSYPAAYNLSNIISVAATDHRDQLASFSNYGAVSVDLAAPGVSILSTTLGSNYESLNGTSMASPHVAGVAALAWSFSPSSTAGEVRAAILGGVDVKPSLTGDVATSGRLNARSTLDLLKLSVVSHAPAAGERLVALPTVFTIDFTHAVDPTSVQASDLAVNGLPATNFTALDPDSLRFEFASSPVTAQGLQTMQVAAGALRRASDNSLINAWASTFYYDPAPLMVSATAPDEGALLTAPPAHITLHFNEALDPASVDVADLVLDFGLVTEAVVLDADSVRYGVSGLVREGTVLYTLKDGAVRDAFGTPGLPHSGHFQLDDPLINRFEAAGPPQAIPDNGVTISTLNIATSITIADLDVQVNLLHPQATDLDVVLLAPDGTAVELFSDVGGSGDNFEGTILDDAAATSITVGNAPFTGRFRPEAPLATLNGFNALGTWTLRVTDDAGTNVGSLENWALIVHSDVDISPRINSVQPLPTGGSNVWTPLSTLNVRFSEVMLPASVNDIGHWKLSESGADEQFGTADDIAVALSLAAAYSGGLNASLSIVGGPLAAGSYRLEALSGGLRDLLGNALDGNGDGTGGDRFLRDFVVRPRVTTIPFNEDFEAGSVAALGGYWEFKAGPQGRIAVSSAQAPHSGQYHLLLDETAAYAGPQAATLHLDLAGKSQLTLDFWQKRFGDWNSGNEDRVSISANGQTWHTLVSLTGSNSGTAYQHHTFNLDAAIAAAGISYTSDFQIRFSQDNEFYSSGGFAFDDIRISQLDLRGPRITSHLPAAQTPGPLHSFVVMFDEPIAAASFTADDVTLIDPAGATVALSGDPIDSGNGRTFSLPVSPALVIAGQYTFRIGPDIRDLAGNLMNQDNDGLSGETNGSDDYDGTFALGPPVAQAFPYVQSFSGGSLASLAGWRFASAVGLIDVTGQHSPHSGEHHLRMTSVSFDSREAVLVMNMSGLAGATDLTLDFWMQQVASTSGSVRLQVSDNGTSFSTISGATSLKASAPDRYEHFAFDLDAALASAGIVLDGDVYIKFLQSGSSSAPIITFDDVRVSNVDVLGPRVTAQQSSGAAHAFTVTFNEAILPASFTAADVFVTGPTGFPVMLAGDPAPSADQKTFTIPLASTLIGGFAYRIGPDVRDLAGNPMNQDNDPLIGEANGQDDFDGIYSVGPPVAQSLPYAQDFESADFGAFPGWSFSTTGGATLRVNTADNPSGGQSHLEFSQTAAGNQVMTLLLNLAGQAGATDLELDFWAQMLVANNGLDIHVSGNGTSFSTLALSVMPPALGQYTHFAFDLDAALASAGIVLDSDVYVRFTHSGSSTSYKFTLDDLRISQTDVFGPRVASHTVTGSAASFSITFNEPIDPTTFTAADVLVTGPTGFVMPLAGDPVPSADHRTFTLTLPTGIPGNYVFLLGPEIADVAGNRMNQDNDSIGGELNGHDDYDGTYKLGPPAAQSLPYLQDFESGDITSLAGLSFSTTNKGTTQLTSINQPHGGDGHLMFEQVSFGTQQVVLLLDLAAQAGASDLALDFWLNALGSSANVDVSVSGNGTSFVAISNGSGLTPGTLGTYSQFVFDLDAILTTANVVRDSDVYLRFNSQGSSSQKTLLDDIRISHVDVFGPRITGHSATTSAPSFTITFNEPIDPATFTAGDLVVTGPAGRVVPLAGHPLPSADHRTFTVNLASGVLGSYSLRVASDVSDAAGNRLNQDNDPRNGETNGHDDYTGSFILGPATAQTLPHSQGFEAGDLALLPGWSFGTTGTATIDASNAEDPRGGSFHLRFDQSNVGTQQAVLLLDLADQAGRTDLSLDFWAKALGTTGGNSLTVEVSGDGAAWSAVPQASALTLAMLGVYTQYAYDFDAALTAAGIAFDSSVYVRFTHNGSGGSAEMVLDDIRIAQLDLLGPRITAQSAHSVNAFFTLTFSEPLDPATFTASDLTITGPTGYPVAIVGQPVPNADQRVFTIELAAVYPGAHTFRLGPDVRDVAGNIMNQDNDPFSGELNGDDDYEGSVKIGLIAAQSIPYDQGFEAGNFTELPGWSFAVTSPATIDFSSADGPHGGARHLKFAQTSGGQEAVLKLDLSQHVGATNLALAFWLKTPATTNSVDFSVSGNGVTFVTPAGGAGLMPPSQDYTHYAFDLDAVLAAASIVHDGDVYVRWTHSGNSETRIMLLDDVRVSTDDVFGPRVISAQATSATSAFTVQFSEPIDTASFTAADIAVTGPAGYPVVVAGDPVPSVDQRTFTITLASGVPGTYSYRVGPEVRDLVGNVMNQDNDPLAGELNGSDDYDGSLKIGPPPAQTFPYSQDFEAGSLALLPGWSFSTTGSGLIDIATTHEPASGSYHALFGAPSTGSQTAILLLDLAAQAGATNLTLDFWYKGLASGGLQVAVSGDGINYWSLGSLGASTTAYTHYAFDLDARLASSNIQLDSDVYVRFVSNSRGALDDVRVSIADVLGPRVVSVASVSGATPAFNVTFDEAIDPASFTVADIVVTGPDGFPATVIGAPLPSADRRSFTIQVAGALRGRYTFAIGPDVRDDAGNLMNQDNDAQAGETADNYKGDCQFLAALPQPYPFFQDFSSGDIQALPGWSFDFTSTATTEVTALEQPRGTHHLKFDQATSGNNLATFVVDLASQAGATDLTLDFWLQSVGTSVGGDYINVEFSGNGSSFGYVSATIGLSPTVLDQYAHFAFDFDALLAARGIAHDGDVYVRFVRNSFGQYYEMTLDDVRISNADVLGPRVLSHSPGGGGTFTVTFSEPIDPTSFTAADVAVSGPHGFPVALLGDPVPSADQRTFTISLASSILGSYALRIGPDVRDAAGNAMNQDGDALMGEGTADDYDGTLVLGPPAAQVLPYFQGFEGVTLESLPGWSFAVTGVGGLTLSSSDNPHSGSQHLQFSQAGSNTTSAMFLLDLSGHVGATNLALDFWLQTINNNSTSTVHVSGDGVSWNSINYGTLLPAAAGQYTQFAFDLDAALATAGIVFDSSVWVRFQRSTSDSASRAVIDDIRVSTLDLFGPRIQSHSLTTSSNAISVTFSEAINPATFTAADLSIVGPTGFPVGIVGQPVPSTDQRTFTITLASGVPGSYSFVVGPNVSDVAGNRMNQDQDPVMGEATGDSYSGTFVKGPVVPQSVPYLQDFEAGNLEALPGWSFAAFGTGATELISSGAPHSGEWHLKFDQPANGSQTATLALDLSSHAGTTNLTLDFWLKATSISSTNLLDLFVSADGASYVAVPFGLDLVPAQANVDTHYAFDLDGVLAGAGIALDRDVFVRFAHDGSNADREMLLDDVRISHTDVLGPRVASNMLVSPTSTFTITFNEPIDPASFTAADIAVTGPTGFAVALAGDPVPSADNRVYTITLGSSAAGAYALRVGPEVYDLAGNALNQDGDLLAGETTQDVYAAVVTIAPPLAQSFPYQQGFEGGDALALPGWSFVVSPTATIAVTTDAPHSGGHHLKFAQSANGSQQAVLLLDLSSQVGATDLTFDFWLKALNSIHDNTLVVFASNEGTNWTALPSGMSHLIELVGVYQHLAFDLDAALASAGVILDSTVYLRFVHEGAAATAIMMMDDIRASNADVLGPWVTALNAGAGHSFTVTFNEPIDPATLTAANINIVTPTGQTAALVGEPVASADHRSFTMQYTGDALGMYRVHISSLVSDTAGNRLNQDNDWRMGELFDAYSTAFNVGAPAAQTLPYLQDFETSMFASLAGWSFVTSLAATAELATANNPHAGARHLKFDQANAGSHTATLLLDLTEHATATNLAVDFWVQSIGTNSSNSFSVSLSGDATNWHSVPGASSVTLPSLGQYLHFSFDLDAALASGNIARDSSVYLRFSHSGSSSEAEMTLDNVRIGTDDVFGPKVVSLTPSGQIAAPGPLTITFDEPIDPATFTAADVVIIGPTGFAVLLAGDPVASADQRTFTLSPLAELFGAYSVRIGPDIRDLAGNPMNQDGDLLAGEGNGVDDIDGGFTIAPPPGQTLPYAQDFESPTLADLPGWMYGTSSNATIELSSANNPRGAQHIRFDRASSGTPSLTLRLDLSSHAGASNLALEFWLQALSQSSTANSISLSFSGNGSSFSSVSGLSSLRPAALNQYTRFAVDLDAALASAGIVLDSDVYVQFLHNGSAGSHEMTLDDVRVGTADVFGPAVIAQSSSAERPGPVSSFTVTFNEPIDPSTFTVEDLSVVNPVGQAVPLAGHPLANADQRTFTISLASAQTTGGGYLFRIGPDVRDLAGNLMNQDADPIPGEALDDDYDGAFRIGPAAAQTLPYLQTFESADTANLPGWTFETDVTGQTTVTSANTPYLGSGHLQFSQTTNNSTVHVATLRLDLSAHASTTNLVLDFWAKQLGTSSSNSIAVTLSGDGGTWTSTVLNINPFAIGQYRHYTLDLDQALGTIVPDGDVYVRFRHTALSAAAGFTIDNLRVRDGATNQAPSLTTFNTPIYAASEDTDFTVTYDRLITHGDESDGSGVPLVFWIESVTAGVLRKNGDLVQPGVTTVGPGEALVWTPPANASGIHNAFLARVFDGDLLSGVGVNARIDVLPVNDAPAIDTSRTPSLLATIEDQTFGLGTSASSLIASGGVGMFTDIDGVAVTGIAVVGVDSTHGMWQYSTNGSFWQSLGSVSPANARLLGPFDNYIRFLPATNFHGTVSEAITFRAWDRSSGSAGQTADTTINGGTTPFSVEIETASIVVTPVNDAPVLDDTRAPALPPVMEDDANPSGVLIGELIASAGGDIIFDVDAGAVEGIAVTSVNSTAGFWQYSTNDGGTWHAMAVGSPSSYARMLADDGQTRVRFIPNSNFSGTVAAGITFRAWDRTLYGDQNGDFRQILTSGGTSAFSALIETASVNVIAVGDTPRVADNTTLEDVLSAAIDINRHAADGLEVTHFQIASITGGALFHSDGATPIANGDFITFAQGRAGVRFLPALNRTAAGSFQVGASQDGSTLAVQSGWATSVINITPVADAPTTIELSNAVIDENAPGIVVGSITVVDPDDDDEHTFTVDDARFEIVAGELRLVSGVALDHESGDIVIAITATDTDDLSLTRTFTIVPRNVNEPPQLWLAGDEIVAHRPPGFISSIPLLGFDPDLGDALTFSVSDNRFEIRDQALHLAPGGSAQFAEITLVWLEISATDAGGLTTLESFPVVVHQFNRAPTGISIADLTIDENTAGAVVGALAVLDLDAGDAHTFAVSDPRFEVRQNMLRLKPEHSLNFETAPSLTLWVTASDLAGASARQQVTIEVRDVPESPLAVNASRRTIFRELPGAWVAQLTVEDPDADSAHTIAVDDPRFEVRGRDLYLRPGQSISEQVGAFVPLTISVFDGAAGSEFRQTVVWEVIAATSDWTHAHQSPFQPYDVNDDGLVTPLDALLVILRLNATGPANLDGSLPGTQSPIYYDVSGDDLLSPLDALLIINYLNRAGDAQGEAIEDDSYGDRVDFLFTDDAWL